MGLNSALLTVAVEAAVLFLISRILFGEVISFFADRRGKGPLLALLRLPGNTVHELSHALGFLLCGYRVKRLLLCVFDREGRGSCTPGPPWSPITFPKLAIGLAALMPLVAGSLLLLVAGRWLGMLEAMPTLRPEAILPSVWEQSLALLSRLDVRQWQTWVFLYLALSLSAELSPSSTDLRYALPTLAGLAGLTWLSFFTLAHARHLHETYVAMRAAATVFLVHAGAVLGFALTVALAAAVVSVSLTLVLRALRLK